MKYKTKTYMIFGLCLLAFAGFGVSMVLLIGENSRCVANPFVYGAEKFYEQDQELWCSCDEEDKELMCKCNLLATGKGFSFDKDGMIQQKPTFDPDSIYQWNFSELPKE